MKTYPNTIVLLAVACLLAGPSLALAQQATVLEVPLNMGMGNAGSYRVTAVAPDGTARVQITPETPLPLQSLLGKAEGHYILIVQGEGPQASPRVLHVQVTDVGPESTLTFKLGAQAARLLKVGELVTISRPAGATTAMMKGLPEVIPFEGAQADVDFDARQAASRMRSINNLKQIGLAFHNFHSVYNCIPPAVIVGPDGKPWHSWRVLILPYIEQAELFNQYDFSQPWDGEKNRKLLDRMPDVYRDPIHGDERGQFTHYAAITGEPSAPFASKGPQQKDARTVPMDKGLGFQTFTDGTSNTVLVAPVDPARKIPWTKPEDIVVGPKFPDDYDVFGKPNGIATPYNLGSRKSGAPSAPFLIADGSVRVVSTAINKLTLAALLTRNGGEVISADAIPGDAQARPAAQALKVRVEGRKATASLGELTLPPPPGR
jgi:hypothetical protein